jgi:hypothetical protein
MVKCNFCGKYSSEKEKVGAYFRRIDSNIYNYLEFCCTGHFNLFLDNTEMIHVNENGLTQKEQCQQDKINSENGYNELVAFAEKKMLQEKALVDQRKKAFGSEENYYNEITKQINKEKGGCFIATAVFGDYNHPTVVDLRAFRDNWILNRKWGIDFVKWYYRYGFIASNYILEYALLKYISLCFIVKPLHIIIKLSGLNKIQ